MDIAILGCGPAGLLAAHAAVEAGHDVTIYSKRVKSKMFGAMYLHRAIPGVTNDVPDHQITVIKSGTREGYAKLVYGDSAHPVSWDLFPEDFTVGWDLGEAYHTLWSMFRSTIVDRDLNSDIISAIDHEYDRTYSTIPLNLICIDRMKHDFDAQPIWVQHGHGKKLIPGVNDDDMMYYNGYPPDGSVNDTIGFDWYRFSQLNKYQAWEFSNPPVGEAYVSDLEVSVGYKPIDTTCTCWPTIKRLGRFGQWKKGVLTHHAYEQVQEDLRAL